MNEIYKLLDPEEQVIFIMKPKKVITLVSSLKSMLLTFFFGIPFLFLGLEIFSVNNEFSGSSQQSFGISIVTVGALFFVFLGLFFIVLTLGYIILSPFRASATTYALTNRRIVVKKGLFGVEIKSIPFDVVFTVDVKIGFFDRFFGTGTLVFNNKPSFPVVASTGSSSSLADDAYEEYSPISPFFRISFISDPLQTRKRIVQYLKTKG